MSVLQGQGVSREDWEQSLGPDYRVDPLIPPEWSVVKGAPTDRWQQPEITSDQLLLAAGPLGSGHTTGLQLPKSGVLLLV